MAGKKPPGERAWAVFEAHARECALCHDLRVFKKLEPVETDGTALPDELCANGRKLLSLWLEGATAT